METAEGLGDFVRRERKALDMTQEDLARRAGVSLSWLRALEQHADRSFQIDKVNQVLALLGYQLGAVPIKRPQPKDA